GDPQRGLEVPEFLVHRCRGNCVATLFPWRNSALGDEVVNRRGLDGLRVLRFDDLLELLQRVEHDPPRTGVHALDDTPLELLPELLPRLLVVGTAVGAFEQLGFDLLPQFTGRALAGGARPAALGLPLALRVIPADAPGGLVGSMLLHLLGVLK